MNNKNVRIKGITQLAGVLVGIGSRVLHNRGKVSAEALKKIMIVLNKGVIDYLTHQNPKRQTALGISYLANHLLFKKEAPDTELFPLEIITVKI